MELTEPVVIYTATTNLEAHVIANMLLSNGIAAHAIEDQSGVSLWSFGTIGQFHQPNIYVSKSEAERAAHLLLEYEKDKREHDNLEVSGTGEINVICEECSKTTIFPKSLDGTTQDCSHCQAYVDVGDLPWEEDFGKPEG